MELLNHIASGLKGPQKELAKKSGYSIGMVNACLRSLKARGYLDAQTGEITSKAQDYLLKARPTGAVILAAGYGMRMVPINLERPKGLLQIKGEVLIERLICQLIEAGVSDITVVVGFMKESFEYLMDKYNVRLLVNPEYGSKNNLFSLLRAKKYLKNCYILPCDIWCRENPFRRYEPYSWYMVGKEKSIDSNVYLTRALKLGATKRGGAGNRMIGIAYFTEQDAKELCKRMEKLADSGEYTDAFWEEALCTEGENAIAARVMENDAVKEINTYEQLKEADCESVHLRSNVLQVAADVLHVSAEAICDVVALKKGMTNRSFAFSCLGKRYIVRVPGEGTECLINRTQEAEVYHVISGKGLCDDPVYIDPKTGYKITTFLENVRTCDPFDTEDLKRCMKKLRAFHEMHLSVKHEFDIFRQIQFYENLWEGAPSAFSDYEETKKNVFKLKTYIDSHASEKVLTHIDAVPDNFLFYYNGGEEKLQLADWEYAGMQDPHVDIAMFCIYAMYNKEQIDRLIELYFDGKCPHEIRLKIYCYVAVCGLLWSNWCEYKRSLGVEFGEYSLRQYRYAKEYYRLFQKESRQTEDGKGSIERKES